VIEYDGRKWLGIALTVRGSVLSRLFGRALSCAAIGAVAAYAHGTFAFRIPPIAHTMIGVALGLLLVFRTNASYDRYWEGRRLPGAMVIRVRDLTRQAVAYLPGPAHAQLRARLRALGCAYFRLSAMSLRGETDLGKVALLSAEDRTRLAGIAARPQAVSAWMTVELAKAAGQGQLSEQRLFAMDQNLLGLTDALAGCERILRTPVPFAYAQHIKVFVVLFCFTAPFAMADSMSWGTPVAAALLAFALFGIDEIGVEIEDPFGYDPNDLPIEQMADGLERATEAVLDASPGT
jgi:putative membrane protein